MPKTERLYSFVLFFVAAEIIFFILYLQPFYGLMDDHLIIDDMIRYSRELGLLNLVQHFSESDLQWGMFRPLYPIMGVWLYTPSLWVQWPPLLFLMNAVWCFGIFFFFAKFFEKINQVAWQKTALLYASFFYAYDLFQHPSLQEKLVHTNGLIFLYLCSVLEKKHLHWVFLWIFALLGVVSKTSFCIYLAMGIWLLFSLKPQMPLAKRILATIPLVVFTITGVVLLGWISTKGNYTTGHYSLSKIGPNIFSLAGAMFIAPVFVFIGYGIITRKLLTEPILFVSTIGTLAFLALFLPWGIQAYLQTDAAPFFCAMLALIVDRIFSKNLAKLVFLGFSIMAIGVTTYRAYTNFGRLHDIDKALRFIRNSDLKEIYVPCVEGRGAMATYLRIFHQKEIPFLLFEKFQPSDLHGKTVFHDQAMCPFPERSLGPEQCKKEILFQGLFPRSYRIVKFDCI